MSNATPIVGIACSVYQPELNALNERGEIDLPVRYLDSQLHMVPAQLREQLTKVIDKERAKGNRVLLLYGDCHVHMIDHSEDSAVRRIKGINCCSILLGKDRYRELVRGQTFFLFPEWVDRWRELMVNVPSTSSPATLDLVRDQVKHLVYLDTGIRPVPKDDLNACADHFGLAWEAVPVTLDLFRDAIVAGMDEPFITSL